MPTFQFNKIIRDKRYMTMVNEGYKVITKVLTPAEQILELKRKLLEEVEEVKTANDKDEIAEELADVIEVIHALAAALKIEMKTIQLMRKQKLEKNGGFEQTIYVQTVSLPMDSSTGKYLLSQADKYPIIEDE